MIKLNLGAALLTGVLLASSSGHAAITWDLEPAGTNAWDWTLTGPEWTYSGPDSSGNYSASWAGIAWTGAAAECIELATVPVGVPANPDTRIWVSQDLSQAGNFRSLNDDFGGTLQSKARLWIALSKGGSNLQYFVKIAPYSSAGNSDEFNVTTTRRDLTQAQCTTGQSSPVIPWVVITGDGPNGSVTFSPNAG